MIYYKKNYHSARRFDNYLPNFKIKYLIMKILMGISEVVAYFINKKVEKTLTFKKIR